MIASSMMSFLPHFENFFLVDELQCVTRQNSQGVFPRVTKKLLVIVTPFKIMTDMIYMLVLLSFYITGLVVVCIKRQCSSLVGSGLFKGFNIQGNYQVKIVITLYNSLIYVIRYTPYVGLPTLRKCTSVGMSCFLKTNSDAISPKVTKQRDTPKNKPTKRTKLGENAIILPIGTWHKSPLLKVLPQQRIHRGTVVRRRSLQIDIAPLSAIACSN